MPDSDRTWIEQQVGKTLVGRYRLEQVLGVGGMGAVYAGTHVTVGRRVAIKLLLPSATTNEVLVKRFHSEARSAAAVARRGVVDVLDFDVDPETGPFLVMEYLYGEPLGRHIERLGTLSLEETLWIGASLLRTLGAVHERGIVHRDLKPDNVFLSRAEGEEEVTVKIVDFGISRVTDPERQTSKLTTPGAVMGTPVYMSPEQARGEPSVDHRTDIYAVGAILYECLAGRPPYIGESWQQVFAAVLTTPPKPLASLRSDLPAPLYAIVDKAMARGPADRFPSAQAMRDAVEALRGAPPATRHVDLGALAMGNDPTLASGDLPYGAARPTPLRSRERGPWLVLGALAITLLLAVGTMGTFVYLAWNRRGPPEMASHAKTTVADAGRAELAVPSREPPEPGGGSAAHSDGADASDGAAEPAPSQETSKPGHTGAAHTERAQGTRRPPRPRPGRPAPTAPVTAEPVPAPAAPTPATEPDTGEDDDPVLRSAAATLATRLERAHKARKRGKAREARRLYEEVVTMAFRANVPLGSAASRRAAEARMALGDMAVRGIRSRAVAATTEEANAAFRQTIDSYSRAAQQYGKVAEYGHTDLTQCALVRSARAAEKLHQVVSDIEAPADIAARGPKAAADYEAGFESAAEAYLKTALALHNAVTRMPGGSMACRTEARDSVMRILKVLKLPAP